MLRATGVAIFAALAVVALQPTDADLRKWVDDRVEAWQPTKAEKRFDDIGWAPDVRSALKLAREHNRPLFLFTHDGRIEIGRC